ncbi:hypothetical protein L6164_014885 [Bauhinia variegata]|uniref:Uncharacterized protein n=1 Tax=Bauhinia variegata TaxID=167791 RepID=A0ACB9NJZ4_BAUVA|nr:hypothetical protein L6164_014885 [Bauhinia variegata]
MFSVQVRKRSVVILAITMLVLGGLEPAECAFAIPLNPCTLAECIAECKKALQAKFLSATCAASSQGKLCICLG